MHELNGEVSALLGIEGLDGVEYLRVLGVQGHGYAAAGDVHGVSRDATKAIRAELGGSVSFAVLVREPERRLLSQVALFRRLEEHAALWDITYIDDVIDEKSLSLPDRSIMSRLFVHGANMLNAICDEVEVGPVFRVEDVAVDTARLSDLVRHLSADTVEPDERWLTAAIASPAINSHRRGGDEGLTSWQQEVVRSVVTAEAWAHYEQLGYQRPVWL